MRVRALLVLMAVSALFAMMALSFAAGTPWPTSATEIPVFDPDPTTDHGIANRMFGGFAIAVILIAVLLGAAMIGGVYLAKMDEPGKVGP